MKKMIALLLLSTMAFGCKSGDMDKMADDANASIEAEANAAAEQAEADAKAAAEEAVKVDVVDTAISAGTFTTLVSALTAAELVEALKGEGPFTVFAPTDEAFAKLPEGTVEELLKTENKDQLVNILKFHVVPARVMAADVTTMEADTLAGTKVNVVVAEDGTVTYQGANVVKTDIDCTNGVIHVIDTVAMPPAEGQAAN